MPSRGNRPRSFQVVDDDGSVLAKIELDPVKKRQEERRQLRAQIKSPNQGGLKKFEIARYKAAFSKKAPLPNTYEAAWREKSARLIAEAGMAKARLREHRKIDPVRLRSRKSKDLTTGPRDGALEASEEESSEEDFGRGASEEEIEEEEAGEVSLL